MLAARHGAAAATLALGRRRGKGVREWGKVPRGVPLPYLTTPRRGSGIALCGRATRCGRV